MEAILLDTNIISYLMRGNSRAAAYRSHIEGKTLVISFMTVAELYEGAFRAGWSAKRVGQLREQIRKYVVVPFSPAICETWGHIRAGRRHMPISVDDAWIAATAIAYKCPLVTHNPSHFSDIPELQIITQESAREE